MKLAKDIMAYYRDLRAAGYSVDSARRMTRSLISNLRSVFADV